MGRVDVTYARALWQDPDVPVDFLRSEGIAAHGARVCMCWVGSAGRGCTGPGTDRQGGGAGGGTGRGEGFLPLHRPSSLAANMQLA